MRATVDTIEGKRIDFELGHVTGIELGERISISIGKAIAEYLNYVIELLGLTQWRVHLYDGPPENESASAMVNSRTDTWDAGIWIADTFFDDSELPDDYRTRVLIHEMIHLHFETAWNFAEDTVMRAMGAEAYEVWKRAYREQMELGIDQLSVHLAKLVPKKFVLPDERAPAREPKARKRKS